MSSTNAAGRTDRDFMPKLRRAAPVEAEAYTNFSSTVMSRTDGTVPPKYRELIAIGVALTTQCRMCLESHTVAAKKAGASEEEIAETAFVAAALRAGAAYTHGFAAMRCFDEAGH
ncbi:carboxymuconolactone decarboxylase family protein [Nonomuraea insulae]|uniref:Carboxymuconolactone decarboxylase family protein n=1 Tax=Nonomuraea insulae TaxID=1616787 RepID=A0ABW1DD05_9ACTN